MKILSLSFLVQYVICFYHNFLAPQQFFKANDAPAAERAIQQSLESIRLNTEWLKRDETAIKEWLKNKGF